MRMVRWSETALARCLVELLVSDLIVFRGKILLREHQVCDGKKNWKIASDLNILTFSIHSLQSDCRPLRSKKSKK